MAEEIKLEKVGESISHHGVNSGNMNHRAGEFSQVEQVALLPGGQRIRHPEQGKC